MLRWLAIALGVVCGVRTADAFEIETEVSDGCHEELTFEGAIAAGFPAFADAPAPTEEQSRAMADLVFTLPRKDPWTLALLVGVRSNDLRDYAPTAISALVHVHDDPDEQPGHCIRQPMHDGPGGDQAALAACRAFIVGELEAGGLLDETIDLARTEQVSSYFNFRGRYEIALPTFAYRLGRAVHALEDGFTHTMRDEATGHVVHVLNWIDAYGSREYEEARDGYPHLSGLDQCRRTDSAHQIRRVELAREAVTRLLAAIGDPSAGRRERVLAVLDEALALEPGCTIENRYCDAPELAEPTGVRTFGCSTRGGAGLVVFAGVLAVLARRRRSATWMLAIALALVAPAARADDEATATGEQGVQIRPGSIEDPGGYPSHIWHADHWHFDARVGASADEVAVGGMVGIGRKWRCWNFGVVAEWNPWFSLDRIDARPGVINLYATAAYRWFKGPRLTISTRAELGSTTMLFEMLGIDRFTTGLYIGGALATIRLPVTPGFAFTFDPIHFVMPTPRPFGLPFYFKQYRATVGIEVRL